MMSCYMYMYHRTFCLEHFSIHIVSHTHSDSSQEAKGGAMSSKGGDQHLRELLMEKTGEVHKNKAEVERSVCMCVCVCVCVCVCECECCGSNLVPMVVVLCSQPKSCEF